MTHANKNASDSSDPTVVKAADPEIVPPPEPWTPAKVLEWNAYYDLYVAVGVILLSVLVSIKVVDHSSIWTQLESGKQTSATFNPGVTDTFSYTAEGSRWVHISWLADFVHYQVFHLVGGFAPTDGETPAGKTAKMDQWGVAALVVLVALLRGATALILLSLRHKGPGLWWTAVCVLFAIGYTIVPQDTVATGRDLPLALFSGGMAGRAIVGPSAWGGLFLAIELLLLHRALFAAKRRSLYALVPLFALWANMDESFFGGLLILVGAVIGLAFHKPKPGETGPCLRTGLIALGACFAATLINPSHILIYPAMLSYLAPIPGFSPGPLTQDQRSPFGSPIDPTNEDEVRAIQLLFRHFVVVVGLGLASFVVNRRRFNASRFLMFVVASALWGVMFRWQLEFGLVLAAVLALNGQEWFQDLFGTEGHLGRGWAIWSTGGRAVTLLAIALLLIKSFTGYDRLDGEGEFGVGYNPDAFPFESAEFVAGAPIEGNVLNTTLAQGDTLIWKSDGKKMTFLDSRRHVFGRELAADFDEVQRAISVDDDARWKPLLDRYKISVVMIDAGRSRKTHRQLMTSKRWVPFRDDGTSVFFGRADASPTDVAFFKKNQLDADVLVYKTPQTVPSTDRLPRPTSELDKIYQNRFTLRPQPHSVSSLRWLMPVTQDASVPTMPDPARAIMAIREARRGLVVNPDDTTCYRRLFAAYAALLQIETAILNGIELKPENTQLVGQTAPSFEALAMRRRQVVTALTYAIQTTPPPQSVEDRVALVQLRNELADIFLRVGYIDLARDLYSSVLQDSKPGEYTPEAFNDLTAKLASLNKAIGEIENQLQTMSIEQQANPIQLAGYAQSRGAIKLAIEKLEEASQAGINARLVKGSLLDLYCEAGMADKALELWDQGTADDESLSDGPGTAGWRQGRVLLLVGNYENAVSTWQTRALPSLQGTRTMDVPNAARQLLRGEPIAMTRSFLDQPDQIAKQAEWELDVALAALEAGFPVDVASKHFTSVLTLTPDSAYRPLVAYYLTKLGKPVPPTRAEAVKAAKAAADAAKTPTAEPKK